MLLVSLSLFTYFIASAEKYDLNYNEKNNQAKSLSQPNTALDDSLSIENNPVDLREGNGLERLFSDSNSSIFGKDENNLKDLLVPDRSDSKDLSLGELFVLDKLFSNNSSLLDQDSTTLGDLFILDHLFNNKDNFFKDNNLSLGELFILDRLFRNNNNLLNQGSTSIGDLFILEQLFNK